MADFVTKDSSISQASLQDYVSCFRDCLQAPTTKSEEYTRQFFPVVRVPDTWVLLLTLKTQVFHTVWTPTYSFALESVSLDPVDLLTAKIHDNENQIQQLQGQVDTLTALVNAPRVAGSVYWRAVTKQQFGYDQTLLWTTESSKREFQLHTNGSIKLAVAAGYAVQVAVRNNNFSRKQTIKLFHNFKSVGICVDRHQNSNRQVATIDYIFEGKYNDELSVVYRGNGFCYPGSYVIIHQLR